MMFRPTDFSGWCEQDVREGIIAKMLERLGYEKGTVNDILRGEQLKLEYDREVFGRPKKSDRPLESFPDYILEVDKTWRWVIEAKPPNDEIGKKEIWQAYSYAKHHEVRAVMYCICNGKQLQIFRTDFAPEAALIKEFEYEEFDKEFEHIANILSPDVVRRNWPKIEIDVGKPLGKGLGSFAQIMSGTFVYKSMSSRHPLMRGLNSRVLGDLLFTIAGGFVERVDDKLRAVVVVRSPSVEGQRISESIGIDKMELRSDVAEISEDPAQPTIFSYTASYTIPPARTEMLGMPQFPHPIPCRVTTTVRAYLDDKLIKGDFNADMVLHPLNQAIPVTIRGALNAQLD